MVVMCRVAPFSAKHYRPKILQNQEIIFKNHSGVEGRSEVTECVTIGTIFSAFVELEYVTRGSDTPRDPPASIGVRPHCLRFIDPGDHCRRGHFSVKRRLVITDRSRSFPS
jgi:hypothetical protein